MDMLDRALHLVNFVAPAVVMALLLWLAGRWLMGRRGPVWWRQLLALAGIGSLAQAASLWWWGQDGRMIGYGMLVLCMASCQWLLLRGWAGAITRRG